MAIDKPYKDIPGTTIFDSEQASKGYHLNQFCMSLMKSENRERFKANERAYLDALAELGRREEPFLLLTVFGGGRKLSQAGEREQAIWFKRTRAQFGALCGACAGARVAGGAATAAR